MTLMRGQASNQHEGVLPVCMVCANSSLDDYAIMVVTTCCSRCVITASLQAA
jgi:hypothetical protein